MKFKHPLVEHYLAFLDILNYRFPSYNQKLSKFFFSHFCLTFRIHIEEPDKTHETHCPTKPNWLGHFENNLGLLNSAHVKKCLFIVALVASTLVI